MRRRTAFAAVATGTALALLLSACDKTPEPTTGNEAAAPAYNGAVGKVFNPSTKAGGTIKYGFSDDWDSLDPGDTYYGYAWNFVRYYGRSLTMFKTAPGSA